MDKVLKAGIVGYGYMGQIRQRVIENNPRVELMGICDTNAAVRSQINGCRAFTNFEDMLKHDVDIIFVCTPNCHSPQIVIQSIKSGKHVFCEKPPGRNVEDIIKIRKAEKSSIKLMFGFNHRFHPGVIKAKVMIDTKKLGRIIGIQGTYGKSGGVNFRQSWRNNLKISGGGILLDQGIHMLDLFRYFCGDFEKVKCFTGNLFWKFDTEDNAYVILKNRRGQIASLHSSATLWRHAFRLHIIMENGYLNIEGLLSKTGSYGRESLIVGKRQFEDEASAYGNPAEEITYFDRDLSWELEIEEFIKCIEQDKPVTLSSSYDALKVMEIIEKAYNNSK